MQVYDVERDALVEVSEAEARAGMVRYARSLGAGSAACGVWERRALGDVTLTDGELAAAQRLNHLYGLDMERYGHVAAWNRSAFGLAQRPESVMRRSR